MAISNASDYHQLSKAQSLVSYKKHSLAAQLSELSTKVKILKKEISSWSTRVLWSVKSV
jgi:hypothetical protein